MSKTYFIDTNILMYAVGSPHPLKEPCLNIWQKVSEGEITAVTNTEVFQEIAYRYWCQKKWKIAKKTLKDFETLFSEIFPIEREDLKTYYDLLDRHSFLSPRDAIHATTMKRQKVKSIITADKAFQKLNFVKATKPQEFS